MSGPRHEHEFEPVPGLPERLPEAERMLWQGAPDAGWVARKVFHLPLVAAYFAALLAWQGLAARHDGTAWREVGLGLATGGGLALLALALLGLLAWLSARTTLYTLTDRRVVMRVGIVLTVTYNLPLRCIDEADVHPLGAGHGDLALALRPGARIAYLHLWPHARPWHLRRTQPMLRCLPRVDEVAALLARAWSAANAEAAAAAAQATAHATAHATTHATAPASAPPAAHPTATPPHAVAVPAKPGHVRRPALPTLVAGR